MSFFVSKNKARFLFLVQIAFIASSASWNHLASFWFIIVFPVFFALAGGALANNRKWFLTYLTLSTGTYLLHFPSLGIFGGIVRLFLALGAFFILFREIINHCFTKPDVPRKDRILAGITGYLATGLFWFFAIHVVSEVNPEAFLNQITSLPPTLAEELYLSFVTLTTLGYGDIIPISPTAKVTALLTTLTGVLYLAVFISALIGNKD